MNLGVERSKIGDILTDGTRAFIFVCADIAPFLCEELRRVKHTSIYCERASLSACDIRPKFEELRVNVASERADAVIAAVYKLSRETASALARRCPGGTVGVLATDGTIQTGLYQKALEARGLAPWTPPAEIQKEVMHQIYDRVKKGLPWDRESWARIEDACREAGCAAVVLACTELSVIKADQGLADWYVDPMEVLARKVIETAGKTYR